MADVSDAPAQESARRRQLLDAALGVFAKFGYRKTSMDEVARAANLSRQGLYLHFERKEALFRAVVHHAMTSAYEAASRRLGDPALTVRARLVAAFDEWLGRQLGAIASGGAELGDSTDAWVLPLVREYEERFLERLTKFVRSSGLLAAYKPAGLTARQVAEVLHATARGFTRDQLSREQLREGIDKAVRALCLPLRARA